MSETQIVLTKEEQEKPIKLFFQAPTVIERFARAYQDNEVALKALSTIALECSKNDLLANCSKISLLQSGLDAANLGLIPNRLTGHAYLIPYKNKKDYEAQLQIGYRGYVAKYEEAGYSVEAELVTNEEIENGRFEEERGTHSKIIHKPIRKGIRNETNIALGYAIARKEGREPLFIVMSLEEIVESAKTLKWDDSLKKKVPSLGNVWKSEDRETDFGQMCKKTLLKRLSSIVPIASVSAMANYEFERDNTSAPAPEVKAPKKDIVQDELEGEKLINQKPEEGFKIILNDKSTVITNPEEATAFLKEAMSRHETRAEREVLFQNNIDFVKKLDSLNLQDLATSIYQLKNSGE